MEGKVLLYNSDGAKIGETFIRRARQLVKKQRATWVDDNQDAIRFAPGMENADDSAVDDMYGESLVQSVGITDGDLLKLAKRRVYSQFAFRLHSSIVLVLCPFLVMIYFLTDPGGFFWPVFPVVSLLFSVVVHWVVSKLACGGLSNKVALEYERLKQWREYGSDVDMKS